jgi:ABC-type multidrug transport system fused ATPase/permease subunit
VDHPGAALTVTLAVTAGIVWMVAQALMPAVVGLAIDEGVAAQDSGQLRFWAFALLGVGLTQALAGIVRHRFSVVLWLDAAFRSVQLIGRASARIGAALPKRVATGEVVSVGANDMAQIGNSVDALGRAVGSLVAFIVVSFILLNTSMTLGLTVLLGLPLLLLAIGPLLRPLQQRNMAAREMQGELNSLASDIVAGLRVLRGIGGEDVFHRRYVAESQRVREAGVRVAKLQSLLDALQVLLPGAFVVVVVWLGARLAVQGAISPGELVAFYGYAAFLVIPLRTATEFANKVIRGRVAASRLLAILALQPEFAEPTAPAAEPGGSRLVDEQSGFVATPGCSPRSYPTTRCPPQPLRTGWASSCPARSPSTAFPWPTCPPRWSVAGCWCRTRPARCSPGRCETSWPYEGTRTTRTCSPPCPPRRPRTCSTRFPAVLARTSRRRAVPSPGASASAWCSPVHWSPILTCSFSWSRRRRSTPTPRHASPPASTRRAPGAPRS